MAGKSKKFKIQINLTNRWLYTLIAFFSLIIIGVFVYATAPNPGHEITEIEPPGGCGSDQFLQWNGSWTCADASGSELWTQSGSDIYYNAGKVGIGLTSPDHSLQVDGTVQANIFSGDGQGLTNLRVLVTPSSDVCDGTTHGLLKYKNSTCTDDDEMSSLFELCMRQGDSTYDWYTVKIASWEEEICDEDGCPGQTYFNCVGGVDCPEPGCYDEEPEDCFDCEPAPV